MIQGEPGEVLEDVDDGRYELAGVKQSSLASCCHAHLFNLVLHSSSRPFDSWVMLEHYPTVLTTEILEIKTRLFGPPEPTLKKWQRHPHADARSPYASSTTLRDEWPLPSTKEIPAIKQALGAMDDSTLQRDTVFSPGEQHLGSLKTRIRSTWSGNEVCLQRSQHSLPPLLPAMTSSSRFCTNATHRASAENASVWKEMLLKVLMLSRSVPDQRDEGCSPLHRDNVSSSGEQGQHSSGIMDE
ncbi:uncharacterized protein ARMOST_20234 [Armillaria ostoyae]|uniref:Uncharacterized protein n=1 Tax=Armillaria ostoyae TaxID=47428 RepID=A0A284S6S8_ARMOS|nr:uncharacterized protein ARMOST_20234 [Armillaria ostoyae]